MIICAETEGHEVHERWGVARQVFTPGYIVVWCGRGHHREYEPIDSVRYRTFKKALGACKEVCGARTIIAHHERRHFAFTRSTIQRLRRQHP